MAAAETPLSLDEVGAALAAIGGFEPRPLIAAGVSGGPDSLALMILLDRWARGRGGVAWGLVVDHRLRPESAAEAATVAGWLAARGIPHAVLTWRDAKPATAIQAAARAARYRLLAQWCVANGCLHLLTAHHRDDQAETYLIRRRAKSGPDGLAGMASVRELPGLRLVRPLLAVPKARLVAFLDAEGQPSIDDPSNRNPAFERARLRLGFAAAPHPNPLPANGERKPIGAVAPLVGRGRDPTRQRSEGGGRQAPQLIREVHAYAAARVAREHALAALVARAVSLHPAGFALIDPAALAVGGELGAAALGRVVAVLGGLDYPVRRERLARLREALAISPPRGRTLGGCRFVPWRGRVLALREPARVAPPLILAPGASAVWDKRFALWLPAAASQSVTVGALGAAGVAQLGRDLAIDDNPLPRLAYPALPAVWDEAGLAAVPHLAWRRATAGCVPTLAFRPAVSLFSAGFTVV